MSSSTGNIHNYDQRNSKKIVSSAELYKLPPNQYTIMELVMTPREISYKNLCEAVKELPETNRLSQAQIDGTLYELLRLGYLTSFIDNGEIIYMAQIGQKGDSPVKRDEQKLWNQLDLASLKEMMKKKNDKSDS